MTRTIPVIFEDGVFRPLSPLDLPEGFQTSVRITTADEETPKESPAEILARIAQIGPDQPENETADSPADHDMILYGWKRQ